MDSTTNGLPDIISLLIPYLNFGLIVVILIMVVRGIGLVPKWVLEDLAKEHARALEAEKASHEATTVELRARLEASDADKRELKTQVQAMLTYQQSELGPALVRNTDIVNRYMNAIAQRGGGV